MNDNNLNKTEVIRLGMASIPLPIEGKVSSNDKPVPWGNDNNYANFLLSLYGNVPIHANIINQKSVHIFGDGVFDKVTNKPFVIKVNEDDTLELFIDKIVKSYLLFNAFAIEVNFKPDGTPHAYFHLPIQRIGLNKSKDKIFYYGEDNKQKVTATFDRYDPSVIYSEHKSKVFYYEGHIPSPNNSDVYPTPDYYQLIKTLMTDIAITEFNYNQITNHFSPSTMISFFNGEPDDELKAKIMRDLRASYSGENGKKLLVNFNQLNGKAPEIGNISAGDWHDAYITIKGVVESTIYEGSGITSPALFGNKTAGQLGSTQELENAYEIWNNSYLRKIRNELEAPLRDLFKANLYFKNKPLFSTSLSEDLKKSIMTINELRLEQGLKPIVNGDRIIGESAPATSNSFSTHKCNSENTTRILTDEDYELVKDLGSNEDEFEIIEGEEFSIQLKFDNESDIVNYIIDNEITDVSSSELRAIIKKELGIDITSSGLKELIYKLKDTGVANVEEKDGKYILKPTPASANKPYTSRTVQTMFKYTKRPEVSGDDLLPTSRGFCVKLMNSKKLYSRADIQAMSALFEYDIFQYTGGFYFNSDTGVTTPYCRHEWKAVSVAKKN
ncbi:hypothetical protein [Pedobacter steynii]